MPQRYYSTLNRVTHPCRKLTAFQQVVNRGAVGYTSSDYRQIVHNP
ncbi:hypothetical protein SBA6_1250006 [Candidatus Sulfopaludibacter sp. SbA6]|nr:hypothetical protein SBA6_1250006 [Candidatus Sulfopaludibacter sp. SbA6]